MDEQRMKEIVNELANTFSNMRPMLLKVLRYTHPTVQQYFTGLCLAWINELPHCNIDDRNRASAETCRKLVEAYCRSTGEEKIPDKFRMV